MNQKVDPRRNNLSAKSTSVEGRIAKPRRLQVGRSKLTKDLERQLLAGLQERVLHPEVVGYVLKQFEEELGRALCASSQGDAELRRQAGELERGIANQLRGLSDAYSASITAEIARLEQQLAIVHERLKVSEPSAIKLQVRHTRQFVESRLRHLSTLWEGDPRIAREEIAKHIGKIRLEPLLRTMSHREFWDWLPVLERAAARMVPGARIAHNSRALSLSIPFRVEVAA